MQFFSPLNDQGTASPQAVIVELLNHDFHEIPENFERLDKRGFELMENRSESLPPANPHA